MLDKIPDLDNRFDLQRRGPFEFRGIHHMITVGQKDDDFVLLLGDTIRCRNFIV